MPAAIAAPAVPVMTGMPAAPLAAVAPTCSCERKHMPVTDVSYKTPREMTLPLVSSGVATDGGFDPIVARICAILGVEIQVIQVHPSPLYFAVPLAHIRTGHGAVQDWLATGGPLTRATCKVAFSHLNVPAIQPIIDAPTRELYEFFNIKTIDILRDGAMFTALADEILTVVHAPAPLARPYPTTEVALTTVQLKNYYLNSLPEFARIAASLILRVNFIRMKGCVCDPNTYLLPTRDAPPQCVGLGLLI